MAIPSLVQLLAEPEVPHVLARIGPASVPAFAPNGDVFLIATGDSGAIDPQQAQVLLGETRIDDLPETGSGIAPGRTAHRK